MRIGSLFSGIGFLELGLEAAGLGHTVWQAEQDPFCQGVLNSLWPEATIYSDVRDIHGPHKEETPQCDNTQTQQEMPEAPRVDMICGGFP